MTTWMIEYSYDDQAEQRDALRPKHRAYLSQLAEQGSLPAFGRYTDEGPAGALLIAKAPQRSDVEAMLDEDPYAEAGLIANRRIREWPAVWADAA
ncbi:YciI family protein [Demequina flava]|uniref:YciI family protein n=1 Tax=Demequina flava TaxID=1095025 RepID=UPI0007819774|nr:YciI family protein [Demequina flava]